jgi:hypothetical protein
LRRLGGGHDAVFARARDVGPGAGAQRVLRPGQGDDPQAAGRGQVHGARVAGHEPRAELRGDAEQGRELADMRIKLYERSENAEETIYRSKAVGEPPLMLGISALLALSDAVANSGEGTAYPALDAPATPERVLFAVERLHREAVR